MTVESATYISGLVPAYPPGSDSISEGDDHLRLLKSVLQGTFPNANDALNAVHTGTSEPTSKTAGTIWYDTTASNKVLKVYNGTSFVTLPISPEVAFKLMGATNVGWVLPTADGIADQFLTTDGAGNLDWTSASGDELPSQTGHSGKFLTTDGSSASWAATTGKLLGVTHKIDSTSNRPATNNTYENNGLTVTHNKTSATSTLFVQLNCTINAASNFTSSSASTITGYLGGSDASASTIITGTTADILMMFFDDVGEGSGVTWDMTNTFSRIFKVTAANCPDGTTGNNEFNWVWKWNDRAQMTQVSTATWIVMEIEE
jgi:hypothetical protein